jgi:hypothetical protein
MTRKAEIYHEITCAHGGNCGHALPRQPTRELAHNAAILARWQDTGTSYLCPRHAIHTIKKAGRLAQECQPFCQKGTEAPSNDIAHTRPRLPPRNGSKSHSAAIQ